MQFSKHGRQSIFLNQWLVVKGNQLLTRVRRRAAVEVTSTLFTRKPTRRYFFQRLNEVRFAEGPPGMGAFADCR
jgi:hypothetical protein